MQVWIFSLFFAFEYHLKWSFIRSMWIKDLMVKTWKNSKKVVTYLRLFLLPDSFYSCLYLRLVTASECSGKCTAVKKLDEFTHLYHMMAKANCCLITGKIDVSWELFWSMQVQRADSVWFNGRNWYSWLSPTIVFLYSSDKQCSSNVWNRFDKGICLCRAPKTSLIEPLLISSSLTILWTSTVVAIHAMYCALNTCEQKSC